jgi:isopentenyldiphosphate isomerase
MTYEVKTKEIPVVDENDVVLFFKSRKNRNPNDIYRISVLLVKNIDGNILITQRSKNLKTQPGAWGVSVSGTLEKEETYETNIIKETKEEIGISNFNNTLIEKIRINDENQNCFCTIFSTTIDRDIFTIQTTDEVCDYRWLSRDELLDWFNKKPQDFNTNFKYFINYL